MKMKTIRVWKGQSLGRTMPGGRNELEIEHENFEKVVFANDLPACEDCGEPWYEKHESHFADCCCIGPTQDGIQYQTDSNGILWGRWILG